MPEHESFIPGRELCRAFYAEIVRPLASDIPHAAGLLGPGSEVLGFDDPMSMDHDWGPRVQIFLGAEDEALHGSSIRNRLSSELPQQFHGVDVRYPSSKGEAEASHHIEVTNVDRFLREYLAVDPNVELQPADWLSLPEQGLLTISRGPIFHDDIGLQALRERFLYYPHDVWLYLLASAWTRIGQEEHLVGRAGYMGDEIGAAIIAARLVRDMMRICFLLERRYAPYPKWFGSGFAQLSCASEMTPLLQAVLRSSTWQERDQALSEAYEAVARLQNATALVPPRPAKALPFFERPFRVIHLHTDFASSLREAIADPAVKAIAAKRNIGSVSQFSDSTDLLVPSEWRYKLKGLYV